MEIIGYADLAERVRRRPARLGRVRLVAVDGPTGSGKSTFAARLVSALGAGARILHIDDLLDGWADTVTFWPRLERQVLTPLRHGQRGTYQPYDWLADRFAATRRLVAPDGALVLDGVTTLRRAVRAELTLGVWMAVPFDRALARAIERDGPAASPHLTAWHEREIAHFAVDDPASAADLVVDGEPSVSHDPATELVTLVNRA